MVDKKWTELSDYRNQSAISEDIYRTALLEQVKRKWKPQLNRTV